MANSLQDEREAIEKSARPAEGFALGPAKSAKVAQRGALNLIGELGLSEVTGRGRYRARGILRVFASGLLSEACNTLPA